MAYARKKPTVWCVTAAICLIYALNGGVRGNYGTLLEPLAAHSGISYGDVSFVFAVSQLVFGLLQPLFGILALKTSNRFVLFFGFALMAGAFWLTPLCHSLWMLMICFGILLPAGAAALSFGLLLSIAAGQISPAQSAGVSGFLNASSGLGTTALAPLLQAILFFSGVAGCMVFLGMYTLLLIPLAFWLCSAKSLVDDSTAPNDISGVQILVKAFRNRNYLFLLSGFFTCGFHMAILETHFLMKR